MSFRVNVEVIIYFLLLPYPLRTYSAKTSVTSPLKELAPSSPYLSKKSTLSDFPMIDEYFSILDAKQERELHFSSKLSQHVIAIVLRWVKV